MLLRFGVRNHRSIRDYQEISFIASSLKDNQEGLLRIHEQDREDENLDSLGSKLNVLPVLAIYGSNAAGKSTMLKAFEFFVEAIVRFHYRTAKNKGTPFSPFLLNDYSRYESSQYDADFVLDDVRYHYGFSINEEQVLSEWLFSFNLASKRQTRSVLFHRDISIDENYYFGKNLKGDNKRIAKSTRANNLFICSAAQNAHPQLSEIYKYFSEGISTRLEQMDSPEVLTRQLLAYFGEDQKRKAIAFDFLKAAEIGISDIDFSKVPYEEKTKKLLVDVESFFLKHLDSRIETDVFQLKTEAKVLHIGENSKEYSIELKYESSGTLALLQILGPVFTKLNLGGVLVVDELNICLHPLVSKELIKLFSSPITNPGKAQLIFSTHDTGMLSGGILRRDQIWFVEKDKDGASSIYPLSDFKTRASDNFEKGYKEGRFGAAPDFNFFQQRFSKNIIGQEEE
ncbi:ATP-binding protein [Pseudomonas sp.]|uniref:AAA family ATPase n=1 Tax=Pseudomonas sp. TaxID=306 RepID=UPI002899C916|nr:ATP-binding protein [Pseudomonas sp.]